MRRPDPTDGALREPGRLGQVLAGQGLLGRVDHQRRTHRSPPAIPRPLQLPSTPHRAARQPPVSRTPAGVANLAASSS
jgi:hypothetical protein